MKKAWIILLIAVTIAPSIWAQGNDQILVSVPKFTYSTSERNANMITKKIMAILQDTKRFSLLDATDTAAVKRAIAAQSTEVFMDAQNSATGEIRATDNVLIGNILSVNTTKIPNSDGTTKGYKSTVSFSLAIKNHATQVTLAEETFTSYMTPLYTSIQKSVERAVETTSYSIVNFFTKVFPIQCKIVQVMEENSKGIKIVKIKGGSSFGIEKNMKMGVYFESQIDGMTSTDLIGEIKVTEVQNANFSIATVTKGGDKIKAYQDHLDKAISCRFFEK